MLLLVALLLALLLMFWVRVMALVKTAGLMTGLWTMLAATSCAFLVELAWIFTVCTLLLVLTRKTPWQADESFLQRGLGSWRLAFLGGLQTRRKEGEATSARNTCESASTNGSLRSPQSMPTIGSSSSKSSFAGTSGSSIERPGFTPADSLRAHMAHPLRVPTFSQEQKSDPFSRLATL